MDLETLAITVVLAALRCHSSSRRYATGPTPHAHGVLIGIVHVAFALTLRTLGGRRLARRVGRG